MAADADEYSVTRSLESYLLWLFGYIMFNNTHGNSVDRILIPYAREIADADEDVPPYVRIDGPRGGVNWAFFKFLRQNKATLTYAILVRLNSPTG